MCDPVSIGVAIGATTGAIGAAATGQDVLTGALLGGVMGGVTGGMGGLSGGSSIISGAGSLFPTASIGLQTSALAAGVSANAAMGFAATSLVGSVAMGMMAPPPQQEYSSEAYGYSPIAYNSVHNTVTGSGGVQASAVLASEIKKAKSNRKKQESTGDTYVNTESFANTGLQLA